MIGIDIMGIGRIIVVLRWELGEVVEGKYYYNYDENNPRYK